MNSKDEIVRTQIIESAKGVFRRYGYQKVSMNDIAKSCGKGRSTLYYYFKNKHEVLKEVAMEEYLSIIEPSHKQVNRSQTISENLYIYNKHKLNALIQKKREYDHLFTDIKEDSNILNGILQKVREIEIRMIKELLQWGMEKKEIAIISPKDHYFLSLAIVTAARSLETEMLLYGSIDEMNSRLPWLTNLLIKGLK
ncbi:TetR/AcrR family transcriptional regulator [Leeuwenhoekiella marinoflava]|uniref:TetR/AcrR family transcriptional regulator n=1 Tax=Leeuwenhoekiella marinoflava TaxID=988 RepID=UPI0030024C98